MVNEELFLFEKKMNHCINSEGQERGNNNSISNNG